MADDRDQNGRFIKGKPGGPGRKPKATENEIRAALHKAMPSADVHAKLAQAVDRGEPWAITLYLAYDWGKPRERLDVGLAQQEERSIDEIMRLLVGEATGPTGYSAEPGQDQGSGDGAPVG